DGPALAATISPRREIGAYEALWLEQGATFKTLADRFANSRKTGQPDQRPPSVPTDARQMPDACRTDVRHRQTGKSPG
ncbi:MAG: hypothetical protein ACRC14_07365, partial [Paracoccaceae bacterium]